MSSVPSSSNQETSVIPQRTPPASKAVDYLNAADLDVSENVAGKTYVYRRRAGQWHCSTGPAIVNDAGPVFMLHGFGVVEESLATWRTIAKHFGKDADDARTLQHVLPARIPGEPLDLRLSRTAAALRPS